jgi:aminoglycoside phosphotransferase (APT) family kinase protein
VTRISNSGSSDGFGTLREAGLAEYVSWRDRRHAEMALPHTVVADALARVNYGEPTNVTRIVGGESSAVFSVEASGEPLILRVKGIGLESMTAEQRVLRAARAHGVHVPEVVAVSELVADQVPFAFMIQRPLGRTNFDEGQDAMSAVEQHQVLSEFGADLARLHAIRTGSTTPHQWHQHLCGVLEQRFREIPDRRCPIHILDHVVNTRDDIRANRRRFATSPIGLTHHDPGLSHIRLDGAPGRQYAGIIDFEFAIEADPLFDIAYFAVWASLDQTRAVIDGHGADTLGAGAAARYRAYRAAVAADTLSRYARFGLVQSAEWVYAMYLRAAPDIEAICDLLDEAT